MKLYLASDHAGFHLKNALLHFLLDQKYDVVDCGPYEYNEEDDYPDYVASAASEVSQSPETSLGIVIGGSGQGEAIMANRFPNVRAAVYDGQPHLTGVRDVPDLLVFTREHNNANMLSLGAWFLDPDAAKKAVARWLSASFSGEERHIRRLRKIESLSPLGRGVNPSEN